MPLHDDEYLIDDRLVAQLVRDQMPQWSDLPIRRLETTGTVNVAYRLGDDKLIRLPRTAAFSDGPQREATWLPVFADAVPLETPEYLALGEPTPPFPSHWSVLRWIDGDNADRCNLENPEADAAALGEFILALRSVSTDGAPKGGSYRGFGLAGVTDSFDRWLAQIPDTEVDRSRVEAIWDLCRSADHWQGPPTWFHSDLHGGNLLARDGRLVAVIDWEGCTVGDPSSDLMAAWWLFDAKRRKTFRSVVGAGDAEWLRAKGWALFMAVAAIPYYSSTNVGFATEARRALEEILAEH